MPRALVPYRYDDKVQPYLNALASAGLEPVPHLTQDMPEFDQVDGVLLTGGTDIDPALYGQQPHPETEPPDRPRDLVELEILSEALRRQLPVLAICRGLQLLNVHAGGTLIQHIDSGNHRKIVSGDRSQPAHCVEIVPGSLLHTVVEARSLNVNSRHHQAVDRVGAGLQIAAVDPSDGIVEALEHRDFPFVLAVQWHPEDQAERFAEQRRLFAAFASAISYSLSIPNRA